MNLSAGTEQFPDFTGATGLALTRPGVEAQGGVEEWCNHGRTTSPREPAVIGQTLMFGTYIDALPCRSRSSEHGRAEGKRLDGSRKLHRLPTLVGVTLQ